MATRNSGYARQPNNLYETPAWVTDALVPFLPSWVKTVWEPACGSGKMVDALDKHGFDLVWTDKNAPRGAVDFINDDAAVKEYCRKYSFDAIITNPPYGRDAQPFIERALDVAPFVAMLLPMNYDCAKGRRHLFKDCKTFSKKITLTKRIVFFDRPGAAPSENHSWYCWNFRDFTAAPTIGYAP